MDGVVSEDAAREIYGVALNSETRDVDLEATDALRRRLGGGNGRSRGEDRGANGAERISCPRCAATLTELERGGPSEARGFQPTEAGRLMGDLEGRYLFEKLYCPVCEALLKAHMVPVAPKET